MLQMYHAVMRFSLNKSEQAHVSVIIIKVVLALCPLHAGRYCVKDACWDAMLQQVRELRVRVVHARGKGLQEVKTEWLAGSHEKAICLRAGWVQASMCDFC